MEGKSGERGGMGELGGVEGGKKYVWNVLSEKKSIFSLKKET